MEFNDTQKQIIHLALLNYAAKIFIDKDYKKHAIALNIGENEIKEMMNLQYKIIIDLVNEFQIN